MVNKIALVFGALGQDGSFICEILLENNYKVFGLIKPNSREERCNNLITYIKEDISSKEKIKNIILTVNPTHIFNFMGLTNIFNPWENTEIVYDYNFLIPLRIIESINEINPKIKFLQASSSLVFGLNGETPQNELTIRKPIYHYGISKNLTDDIIKLYRNKFNLFLCSAILYPHESERRTNNFFSKKIIIESIKIKKGLQDNIHVGDILSYRDIGYAKDYMEACLLIINQNKPDDYVVGSGIPLQNIDFIQKVFNILGLNINDKLLFDSTLKRDYGLSHLVANNEKIKSIGWYPKNNIDDIIEIMINTELKNYE